MSDASDFAPHAVAIATAFWGDPSKTHSTPKEVRWGNGGSKAVSVEKGAWFDYESQQGGGVIDLVMHELGSDKAAALAWLQAEGFIEGRERDPRPVGYPGRQEPPKPADEPPEQERAPESSPEDATEFEVEHYDYANRDGEFQYRVVRYHFRRADGTIVIDPKTGKPAKTFKQKSRDASGAITWGLNGRDPCLYRWQEIELAVEAGKTILVLEGEKAVAAALELGFEATCNSGGANKFDDDLVPTFKDANVVIIADDDPQAVNKKTGESRFHPDGRPVIPGIDHANMVAGKLRGIAASVKVLMLPDLPPKGDIVEWIAAGGTREALEAILEGLPDWTPPPPPTTFGAVRMSQMAGSKIVYDWLIKHLVERHGVLIVAGESGAGKSFFVIDMGMKIARGLDYGGRKVTQGLVIHMAAEDGKGTQLRVEGYRRENGIGPDENIPYLVMDPHAKGAKVFNLMSDDSVDSFIAECLAWEAFYGVNLEAIIIDTVSAAAEGLDENSSAEATKLLARVNRIRDATDATVILVHHMNAGGTKVRGSTALVANVPNVIEVRPMMTIPHRKDEKPLPIKDTEGRQMRRAVLTKNKNGLNDVKWTFCLKIVPIGIDQDGEEITTCVCDRAARQQREESTEKAKLSDDQKLVFDALKAAQDDAPVPMPATARAGPQIKHAAANAVFVDYVRKQMVFKAGEDEIEARNGELATFLKRTTTSLINAGYMGRDGDLKIVWWTGKSDRPARRADRSEPERPPPLHPEVREMMKSDEAPF